MELPTWVSDVVQWPTSIPIVHTQLCVVMIISGVSAFISLLFLTAPYGRYSRGGWGFMINSRLAWFTQEVPSLLVTAGFCWSAGLEGFTQHPQSLRTVITVLFLSHYTYRSLVYPFRIQSANTMPISIWFMSFVFCCWNGFLQGYFLAYQLSPSKSITPRAAVGLVVELVGLLNVIYADHVLVTLRKPGETGYKIPYGGMFTFVSAGNYASEIMEWLGYGLAGHSLSSWAFGLFTFCNLAPRAVKHHQWYLAKFEDYPKARKAVIPFIW